MGKASSSSAADSTINSTGGNIAPTTNNLPWIIGGLVALVALVLWLRRKH